MRVPADGIVAERDSLRGQESYRRPLLLALGIPVAAGLIARLGFEIHRLLFEPEGPIDLLIYHSLTRDWFEGLPIYADRIAAVHPPALFLLLWPIYGWLPADATRWLYAVTVITVLAALAAILLREARPASGPGRVLLALLVVASYPTAITIGIGQITLYVLLAAIAGMLVVLREPRGAARDAAASALFLVALIKPNLTLPFFWVIAFERGSMRPVVLALVAYFAATAVSIALHGSGLDALSELWAGWFRRGGDSFAHTGYGNIHVWLGEIGLRNWIFPASGLVFAVHGAWSWRHRGADPWVLIGVAAIVGRVWAYHRVYDDLLLVFPLIALYRLAQSDQAGSGAKALFALGCVALAAPISWLLQHASWALVAVWLLQLAYLMKRASPSTERAPALSAA
ncbi:MAG: glycosyltransferase 87 family protein [Gemmatimonadota bacterium]